MKITYYPEKDEEKHFIKNWRLQNIEKYNEESTDKMEYIDIFEKFRDLWFEAYNKKDHYNSNIQKQHIRF